jgi:hypothetical protein
LLQTLKQEFGKAKQNQSFKIAPDLDQWATITISIL